MQPAVNVPAGDERRPGRRIYDTAVAGQFIATPYHDVKITDPTKLPTMTTAYTNFVPGSAADLPDIRDVFLDAGLRDMGFAPKTGAERARSCSRRCASSATTRGST